jgi:hypothetical protein
LLEADEVSERAADLACADQRNLVTRHVGKILIGRSKSPGCGVISPFGRAVQVGTKQTVAGLSENGPSDSLIGLVSIV